MRIKWTEVTKRDLECRVPCPKCNKLNFIRGTDTPYFFECEIRDGKRVIYCEECAEPIKIKKTREGVEVIP